MAADQTTPPEAVSPQRKIQSGRDYLEHISGQALVVTGDHAAITYQPIVSTAVSDEERARRKALHTTYLKRLLALTSQVQLAGIDHHVPRAEADACLNLGAIYTALLTRSADSTLHDPARQQHDHDDPARYLSALDQLNRHNHFVLLGDPGSGKSTFVKFVAMCLAGELLGDDRLNLKRLTAPLPTENKDDDAIPQTWDCGPMLPVIIVLRDFAVRGLPPEGQPATAQHLWEFLKHELQTSMLGEYAPLLEHLLRHSGGLVLLDGLDEVPEAAQRRTQIKEAVEDFAASFPECRIVVTSRTYAYQEQDWRLTGFREAKLAPFMDGQIRIFVDRWYRHIADMRGQNQNDAQGWAELLKRAIFSSDQLHDFAQRPLLLTLMASLHAWRGGSLPEKRGELYAEATELLMDWWEQAKVVRNPDGRMEVLQPCLTEVLQVGRDRIQGALECLAFQAHSNQIDMQGAADISEQALMNALWKLRNDNDLRPGRLIEYLSDRAGLLVAHGNQVYSFTHRTFQEYLAACYLTEEDTEDASYPENAATLARRDPNRWREVLLLAAAKAATGAPLMSWLLVDALCGCDCDDVDATVDDAWGGLLAGQALIETVSLRQVKRSHQPKLDRVTQWLAAILTEQQPQDAPFPATERALAGNILAQLGDPRPGVGLRNDGLPDIVWCQVPEGPFTMGSDPEQDSDAYADEQPQHTVQLSSYHISRYPVTHGQYTAFIKDGGYTRESYWTQKGWAWKKDDGIAGPEQYGREFDLPNHPVVGVSWYEAGAFCCWLTDRLRACGILSDTEVIRLPTEAEWEKAARGTDERIYPWGGAADSDVMNYGETDLGVTSSVGCFPRGKSPYKNEDMGGNVYEWCQDWFDNEYYTNSPHDNPQGPDAGSYRVMRGGIWGSVAGRCRAACRNDYAPAFRFGSIGFRLVRTPL